MASIEKVAAVSDIQPGEMRRVTVQGREVLLVNRKGDLLAFAAECTHAGAPLDEGELEDDVLECPWHGGRFSLESAQPVGGPPMEPLSRYKVILRGNDVLVDVGTSPA